MTLRQQQPVVPSMLYQTSAGFHQPLLQAGQRPGVDPHRQRQPPPEIPEVVRKGQARWVSGDEVRQQNQFIDQLFDLAA